MRGQLSQTEVVQPSSPTPPPLPEWAMQPAPPAAPPPPTGMPAGWYGDPWNAAPWRWYDGIAWTGHTTISPQGATQRKPRLPSFLSIPVVLTGLPGLVLIGIGAVLVPLAIALGFVPLLFVLPVLLWMDRLEPEPWSARLHAFLWGAFVAGAVSAIVNTVVAIGSNETVAAVVSAPIIEEIMKAGAIVWAVRRKEVDGVMDGLVYAGFAAVGFAVLENFLYFFQAAEEDLLLETFVGRALLTPFAHPLFTAWAGLAIGLAVRRKASLFTAWWGLALAIASHAAWNGSLSFGESESGMIVLLIAVVMFVVLFLSTAVGVFILRSKDQKRFAELLPALSQRYAVPPDQLAALASFRTRRQRRRELPKSSRRSFDAQAAALHRLAALYDHPNPPDPADEHRLRDQLEQARQLHVGK